MAYIRYGYDFLNDKIKPDEIEAELVGVADLVPDQEWQIIKADESFWQQNHSVPEQKMDLEQFETDRKEQTN